MGVAQRWLAGEMQVAPATVGLAAMLEAWVEVAGKTLSHPRLGGTVEMASLGRVVARPTGDGRGLGTQGHPMARAEVVAKAARMGSLIPRAAEAPTALCLSNGEK